MSIYLHLANIVDRCLPRDLTDEAHRRLSFTVWFSLSGAAFLGFFTLINLASNPTAALALASFIPLMVLAPALVRYAPQPSIGSHWFIFNTIVVLTTAAAAKGGLASSPGGWLPASSFVMVLVLGTRGAIPWILGIVIAHAILGYQASLQGWPEELGPISVFIASRVGATVFSMWLASVFETARATAHQSLERRRVETRMLLDHAEQGFLSIDVTGAIGAETSAIVSRWLGVRPSEGGIVSWTHQADPSFAEWLQLGLESLAEGILPEEVYLDQLPTELKAAGRDLKVQVRPMARKGQYLMVLTDVTEARARQAAEEGERDTGRFVQLLATDRTGTRQFVHEIEGLLHELTAEGLPSDIAHRHLHTIKGNCALFGLTSMAQFVHQAEDRLASTGEAPTPTDLDALATRWHRLVDPFHKVLDDDHRLVVDADDLDAVLTALHARKPHSEVASLVQRLKERPVAHTFTRLASSVEALAERLGKRVEVVCEGGELLLPPQRWCSFYAVLPHLLRNAVDHGVETETQRHAAGKPPVATIRLAVRMVPQGNVEVTVQDDGRGIDWEAIRQLASAAGLPCSHHDDLVAVLFRDGVTTKAEASDVSGRGVGSSAVRQIVETMGGHIEVTSRQGEGTRFVCTAPLYARVSHAA